MEVIETIEEELFFRSVDELCGGSFVVIFTMHRRFFLTLPLLAYAKPEELSARIPEWMRRYKVPGVWVTTFAGGKVTMAEGFGVRSVAGKQPVDGETIFEAASLTKQVTAYVAHGLAAEGKLDFDKPLAE